MAAFLLSLLFLLLSLPSINTLSTVSISQTSNQTLICALQHPNQQGQSNLNCTTFPQQHQPITLELNSNVSYSQIVGGNGYVCALGPSSSSTSIMGCWRFSSNAANVPYKRIYHGPLVQHIDSGNSHVCGLVVKGNDSNSLGLECWQWKAFNSTTAADMSTSMASVAVGADFVCVLSERGDVNCTGTSNRNSSVIVDVPPPGGNYAFVAAGFRHACAISGNGSLLCWGDTKGEIPPGRFVSLALGENRSCALDYDRKVHCWGSNNFTMPHGLQDTFFESIVAKTSVFCGVVSSDYSLRCWGSEIFESNNKVFDDVLPGPCRNVSECPCGPLSNSAKLCHSPDIICQPCSPQVVQSSPPLNPPSPSPLNPSPPQSNSTGWSSRMVAFLVVGCVGCSSLLLVMAFFLYRYCNSKRRGSRVHDSGRLDDPEAPPQAESQAGSRVLLKRLSHVISMGNGSPLEEFSWETLLQVTNNFSEDKRIGIGSFGSVYYATLEDAREVAIKRAEASSSSYTVLGGQVDKDNAFVNELESLSRLHHKNLVRLLGFYEDSKERILVYEYMNNGSLSDHLHKLQTSALMSWPMRIKVALDAARGIEYLHQYATPPIIHRDIKSANILLDAKWTAKVSDFGLSLMGPDPEDEEAHISLLAAGTVGYMDPEYYRLQHLTPKSDVYSFGVVLLELLSGYKAIHKNKDGVPRNVVDFVVPFIVQDEIHRVLDKRVPPPTPYEIEAVAFVGYLAADCVRLEGRDRPTMSQVVNNLERALAACLAQPVLSRSNTHHSSHIQQH